MAMSRSRTPASLSAAGRSIGSIVRPGINDVSIGKRGFEATISGFEVGGGTNGRAAGNGVPVVDESDSAPEDSGAAMAAVGGCGRFNFNDAVRGGDVDRNAGSTGWSQLGNELGALVGNDSKD